MYRTSRSFDLEKETRNLPEMEQQAEELIRHAASVYAAGDLLSATQQVREAVGLLNAAEANLKQLAEVIPPSGFRAEAFRRCGDQLYELEEYGEAANTYQHAVDAYARLEIEEDADFQSRYCARRVLACIQSLSSQPYNRLQLLTAQYEQKQRALATSTDTEMEQGECVAHIARILLRRERYGESAEQFQKAIGLYELDTRFPIDDRMLAIAECHHRIGSLMANRLNDAASARNHYRAAIALYARFEKPLYGVQVTLGQCENALKTL